ncbi:hypothetical protein JYT28_00520 [Desulfobulbus sp. AH-315-M07]|nr:hypothetical protein [Desulfobulbus sp. AH-315-M07]
MGRLSSLVFVAICLAACGGKGQLNARATTSLDTSNLAQQNQAVPVYKREILTKRYHIDQKYKSMMGPDTLEKIYLLEKSPAPELLWIVGYKAMVVDAAGKNEVSQEFMCHANLDFNARSYHRDFKSNASLSGRLFTLSQGQQDIELPEGYGIPIMSNVPVELFSQVLNLNIDDADLELRHQVTIKFIRDGDLQARMVPLFQAAVQGFKSLEEAPSHYGVSTAASSMAEHGAGCSVGLPAQIGDYNKDQFGKKFTGHWVVKPGREENRTLVTEFLQLQFDTTAHYIAVHLHPFAESLELIDRTSGKSLFTSHVENYREKIGIKRINYYEGAGIELFTDHQYELVSVYNNTSGEDQDSMAVMYLYLHDRHFRPPKGSRSEHLMSGLLSPR